MIPSKRLCIVQTMTICISGTSMNGRPCLHSTIADWSFLETPLTRCIRRWVLELPAPLKMLQS